MNTGMVVARFCETGGWGSILIALAILPGLFKDEDCGFGGYLPLCMDARGLVRRILSMQDRIHSHYFP